MTYVAARTGGEDGAPLVFTFHGTGGDEYQFHGVARQLIRGAHVVSPRGDVLEGGVNNRYFRRAGEGLYDMDDLARRRDAMAAFLEAEKAAVDAPRVIGLGYSNGANILTSIALSRPDIVDEMVLMHPMIPWDPDPQPGFAGRRILITAGRSDPICPVPRTKALEAYLKAQGGEVSIHWHAGGHDLDHSEWAAAKAFLS